MRENCHRININTGYWLHRDQVLPLTGNKEAEVRNRAEVGWWAKEEKWKSANSPICCGELKKASMGLAKAGRGHPPGPPDVLLRGAREGAGEGDELQPGDLGSQSHCLHFQNVSQIQLLLTDFIALSYSTHIFSHITWAMWIDSNMNSFHILPHSIFLKECPLWNANEITHFLPSKPGNLFPITVRKNIQHSYHEPLNLM